MSQTDADLLSQFQRTGSGTVFAELVRRHVGLVFHSALRQVRDSHFAEEVAQSVFVKLARDAGQLAPDTILSAWLYQVARNETIDLVRRETRRKRREQIASEMNTIDSVDPIWKEMEPVLDEAMDKLDVSDRTALLLRYFENKSLKEVGALLAISDDTAQKRVTRAIEKLRNLFTQQGVRMGSTALILSLSTSAAKSAPLGLASSISSTAIVAAKSLTAATATTSITHSLIMASFKKVALALLILATTGTCIYQIKKGHKTVPEQISMQEVGAPFQKSAVLARRSQLRGRELALATKSQIIAAYEAELANFEFTNLWAKAEAGDFPSIRELLSNDKYVKRAEEPIRPYLYSFITNQNNTPRERSTAISFSMSFAGKRNFNRPYPETLPTLVSCLEDPESDVRKSAVRALRFLFTERSTLKYLTQLESISGRYPENNELASLILDIKTYQQGGLEAVIKLHNYGQ